MMRLKVDVVGRDADGTETGHYSNEFDLETQAFAQFVLANLFATAQTISDTGGTGRSIGANSAVSAPVVVAGTSTTAAQVTDTNLGAQSAGGAGSQTAVMGAYSGSGTSGSFTVTATITNGSGGAITYGEVGLKITAATFTFLIARDILSPTIPVSNTGTLAVTYTLTWQ